MNLADVQRLSDHWRLHPPLRVLVAACAVSLGVKLPEYEKTDPKQYMTADEFGALVARTGGLSTVMNNGR